MVYVLIPVVVDVATARHNSEAEDVIFEHVIGNRVVKIVIIYSRVVDRDRAGFIGEKVLVRVKREDGIGVGDHGGV